MKRVVLIIIPAVICGVLLTGCDSDKSELDRITYPKDGKYGINILADDFAESKRLDENEKVVVYSIKAELSANSSLQIVIRTIREDSYWGGIYQDSVENWLYSSWDNNLKGNTFTVDESGKSADAAVIFLDDCIIEYYENGATAPTKVKEIKVIY